MPEMTWKIHFYQLDEKGKIIGEGVYYKEYKRKGNAVRVAKKVYGDPKCFKWWLTKTAALTKKVNPYDDIAARWHDILRK
jgi:hypothetical protein